MRCWASCLWDDLPTQNDILYIVLYNKINQNNKRQLFYTQSPLCLYTYVSEDTVKKAIAIKCDFINAIVTEQIKCEHKSTTTAQRIIIST